MKSLRRSGTSSASSSSAATGANSSPPTSSSSSWGPLRALLVSPSAAAPATDGGNLKSPWSRRKRKHALSPQQWNNLFTEDGKLRDGGVKFLKKVRSAGVDPDIRAEVWPFLLGVFDLNSSEIEREETTMHKRKEYKKLRKQCYEFFKPPNGSYGEINEVGDDSSCGSPSSKVGPDSPCSEDFYTAHISLSVGKNEEFLDGLVTVQGDPITNHLSLVEEEHQHHSTAHVDAFVTEESSDSESLADESENAALLSSREGSEDQKKQHSVGPSGPSLERIESLKPHWTAEDYASWRRIIRLDALRVDADCNYIPLHEDVSAEDACRCAQAVGLKDYENLEPSRIYHAARLVEVLESYAIYDQETGYCQGMSDLLSPILTVMKEDHEAFWCFVGFMRKARHNFRLDEAGIKRQLKIVSKIIKSKDAHLYRHLEKLQAEDCFFVYRMVVVLFRRELTFEQTLCLWEVLWADQAAIRANIGRSAWGRVRPRAPPTEDLLLYAIAASVLQRRKLIIEKYSSMDEIVRECNNMTGNLDVWKLLDDAHDLVVTLHDKMSCKKPILLVSSAVARRSFQLMLCTEVRFAALECHLLYLKLNQNTLGNLAEKSVTGRLGSRTVIHYAKKYHYATVAPFNHLNCMVALEEYLML